VPTAGQYDFITMSSEPITLVIDGTTVEQVGPGNPLFTPGSWGNSGNWQANVVTLTASVHRIEIDYTGSQTQQNRFTVSYIPPGSNVGVNLSNSLLDPNYGLATTSTDPDGKSTTTSYSNASIGPEFGLPTATTAGSGTPDASTTTTVYEPPT